MIEVSNLTRVFPGTVAVDDISFSVEKGEIVGFLGPNAAGKTTTMRILTCFLPPTSGSVRVGGFDVLKNSLEVRRRVGYLPESNPLYPEMRVEEYLNFRAKIKKVVPRERAKRVGEVIERCGLRERRRQIIGTLSKGFRQRVGVADAIVHDPELVILDEPTQGLDPMQVREVRKIIGELGEKRTVMLSTHILSEVEKICGRVVIINRGRIVASGTPDEIGTRLTRTRRVRVEARGEEGAIRRALKAIPGVSRVDARFREGLHVFIVESEEERDLRPEIFRLAAQEQWDLCELAYERVSLEDAFAELTTGKEGPPPEEGGGGLLDAMKGIFRG